MTTPDASPEGPTSSQHTSFWRVLAPSFAFAGVQAGWAVQVGHGSAVLRKLGLRADLIGVAWLAGPITGVLVQPVVGALSDRCTSRFGRRRPFMLFGAMGFAGGLLLLGAAARLGASSSSSSSSSSSRGALALALIAFWLLDATLNALQAPSRALLGDVVEAERQALGNAFFAAANGVGKGIGYAVGGFAQSDYAIFWITAAVAFALTLVTLVTVKESVLLEEDVPPYTASMKRRIRDRAGGEGDEAVVDGAGDVAVGKVQGQAEKPGLFALMWLALRESFLALFRMPRTVARAWIVQFCAYYAWQTVTIYGAVYVGREVFDGNADAAVGSEPRRLFEAGVQFANRGLLGMALLSIVLSPILPWTMRRIGTRVTWAFGLAVMGIILSLARVTTNRVCVMAGLVMLAFPLTVTFTIPWTIVILSLLDHNERGLLLSTLNLAQAVPGIFVALSGGIIVRASNGNLSNPLVVAGVAALVGAGLVSFVETPSPLISDVAKQPQDIDKPEKVFPSPARDVESGT